MLRVCSRPLRQVSANAISHSHFGSTGLSQYRAPAALSAILMPRLSFATAKPPAKGAKTAAPASKSAAPAAAGKGERVAKRPRKKGDVNMTDEELLALPFFQVPKASPPPLAPSETSSVLLTKLPKSVTEQSLRDTLAGSEQAAKLPFKRVELEPGYVSFGY
jgi:hypothetical protein